MSHTNLSHRRTHNILLISRLLNQREGASPFTLVLDNLEQTARPLLREYIRRANLAKTHVIFLAFETATAPAHVDTFVPCWNKSPQQIAQAVSTTTVATKKRCLLLIDSVATLCNISVQPNSALDLISFLMSLLQPPAQSSHVSLSLVAVYHQDTALQTMATPYSPSPLSLLQYLATTVITVHSMAILLSEKQAREKSLGTPSFGLAEQKEGVLIGLKPQAKLIPIQCRGLVIQLEHRRKSGRGVLEWYVLPEKSPQIKVQPVAPSALQETVTLLDDHPLFRQGDSTSQQDNDDPEGVTFKLGLTERQRLERDGVVLPYFDAQQAGGGSEGGRILYDMGSEDDFDEEEDEI